MKILCPACKQPVEVRPEVDLVTAPVGAAVAAISAPLVLDEESGIWSWDCPICGHNCRYSPVHGHM